MAADWEIIQNGTQSLLKNVKYGEYLYASGMNYDIFKHKVFCKSGDPNYMGNISLWNFTQVQG